VIWQVELTSQENQYHVDIPQVVPGVSKRGTGIAATVRVANVMSRVLVIGGYPRSLMNFRGKLLESMRARGHEVVACAGGNDVATLAFLETRGIRYFSLPLKRAGMNPFADLALLLALLRLIRRVKPDVVLAYTVKPVIYGLLAARMAGVAGRYALISGLGYAFAQDATFRQRLAGQIVNGLYRMALAGCPAAIFQNEDDRELFYTRKLLPREIRTIRVMGSGVDLEHFAQTPLPPQPIAFLLMARLVVEKGVRDYAAAAARLKQIHPQARFTLLGRLDANPHQVGRAELDSWVKSGAIEYCGETSDVRPYIAQAHVFVLPSYYREGVPRSILEAMALGRPVITTDTPGCRDTVPENANGILVPPRDSLALATAMERFITDPQLAARMGHESRRIVTEYFDVHQVNAVMLETMGL
jgi:glycosyltransferase involved in cell wall biosynthesis